MKKILLLIFLVTHLSSNGQNKVQSKSNVDPYTLLSKVISYSNRIKFEGACQIGYAKGDSYFDFSKMSRKFPNIILKYSVIVSKLRSATEGGTLRNFRYTNNGYDNTKVLLADWQNFDKNSGSATFSMSIFDKSIPNTIYMEIAWSDNSKCYINIELTPEKFLEITDLLRYSKKNEGDEKKLIPAKSNNVVPFLKKNGYYALVDALNLQPVISTDFDDLFLTEFNDGSIYYKTNSSVVQFGLLSKNGEILIPQNKFDKIGKLSEDLIYVFNGKTSGMYSTPIEGIGNYYSVKTKTFINTSLTPHYLDGNPFSEGHAWVINEEGHYGLINKRGDLVLKFEYDQVNDFHNGLAVVTKNGKWGAIDLYGSITIPFVYDYLGMFSNGLAAARKNNKWGFININGDEIVPFIYDYLDMFSNGLAAAQKNDKWGFINSNGIIKIPFIYESAEGFSYGLSRVSLKNKYGLIDCNGNVVVGLKHDGIWTIDEKYIIVGKGTTYRNIWEGQQSLIDTTGKTIIPFTTNIYKWSDGIFGIRKEDTRMEVSKLYYINIKNNKKYIEAR